MDMLKESYQGVYHFYSVKLALNMANSFEQNSGIAQSQPPGSRVSAWGILQSFYGV